MQTATDCIHFNGYKPCRPGMKCEGCKEQEPYEHTTLLINLDNLGNVIQNTAVLRALRRAYPKTHLTWVTDPIATSVLQNNSLINCVMPYDFKTVSILGQMKFDLALNLDKTQRSCALLNSVSAEEKRGFGLSEKGTIIPLNEEADENYRIGLDDELKFKINTKYGTQIYTETLGLKWERDEYVLNLTEDELKLAANWRAQNNLTDKIVIGINTGASPAFAHKSMSIKQHAEVIALLKKELPECAVVLLGGPSEIEKNIEIEKLATSHVIQSPLTEGVRRGMVYVQACDIVITGDTSGLHMSVGLAKWVVGYFGVTCASEIDIYDRGEIITSSLNCSPCWNPHCENVRCIAELDLCNLVEITKKGVASISDSSKE